jgi:hypothetical protein
VSIAKEMFLFYMALLCLVASAGLAGVGMWTRRRLQAGVAVVAVGAWSVVAGLLFWGPW